MQDELLEPFLSRPRSSGVFCDFDGTLSEIVAIPSDARPVDGARRVLDELTKRFACVAVISGRSAHELLEWLGPDIRIFGVHGAETTSEGSVVLSERAAAYSDVMHRVLEEARAAVADAGLRGALVEDKGVVIALHYRAALDRAAAEEELDRVAAELTERYGLTRGEGRLVFELRPPVTFSKADVLIDLVEAMELDAALFVGDDTVDLPAFDALDALATRGVSTLKIAVASEESPDDLIARADVVVQGPAGVVAFLQRLL
jgi:trehalose 6-phosphate phosphatase